MPHQTLRGLLLINLGTPSSPEVQDVRSYLAEFLMDPLVVDIHPVFRFFLVYGFILPTRPKKSSKAYKKIWNARGSPLSFHLEDLKAKVSALHRSREEKLHVYSAMRYGRPTIQEALEQAKRDQVSELIVFPLYPQYSLSATESSIRKVLHDAKKIGYSGELHFVPPFYNSPGFVRAFAKLAENVSQELNPDHVLFSFHGLPERQIRKAKQDYRLQCVETTHLIAQEMRFSREDFEKKYSFAFQSRLGRTPWIRPYTDHVIPELAKRGVKRLMVLCPSFVGDCLETLEEIGIRGRESFIAAGGEELRLVSSLNSSDEWVHEVCELTRTAVRHEK